VLQPVVLATPEAIQTRITSPGFFNMQEYRYSWGGTLCPRKVKWARTTSHRDPPAVARAFGSDGPNHRASGSGSMASLHCNWGVGRRDARTF